MVTFRSLFASEVRRCLSRRAVRVLVGVGLLMIVATGVIAFFAVKADEVMTASEGSIARLTDLWRGGGEGTMIPVFLMLIVGALIGGAMVTGGEWRAGTVVTVSTWEPRRVRLLGARFLACAVLAAVIGLGLLALFVAATLPVAFAKGSTAGVDGAFVVALAGGVARGLSIVALAAVVGAAVANLGRTSTAAIVGLFGYNAIVEPVLRGVWPRKAGWLFGENMATWLSYERLDGPLARSPVLAGATLLVYATALAAVVLVVFRRRDLAGAS